ncbi:YegP family protein [Arthrobacter silvisoli]|uniref:YegP family protein n=1 Tax=Arthrobacter silvisoli TaxID=2291022 RepID=UPI001443CB9E|nr:YegP family protein [Arthrobacter silvisoli]
MAGYFELVDAPDGGFRVALVGGDGELLAMSVTFPSKQAAVQGIWRTRELAGTGLIRDRSRGHDSHGHDKVASIRHSHGLRLVPDHGRAAHGVWSNDGH